MEKSREQKNTIIVCVMTAFITTFMGSALNLSVPALEEEFRVGAQTVGWVVTLYMLTCAALAVPFGRPDKQRTYSARRFTHFFCSISRCGYITGHENFSFFQSCSRNRRVYDLQYQYCYSGRCIQQREKRKGFGVFDMCHIHRTVCRPRTGRNTESESGMESNFHSHRRSFGGGFLWCCI